MVFFTILLGLVPSFLMVGLGGLVRNRLSANAWQGLDKLNFEILFPALIFVAASSRPIAVADVVRIGPMVWAVLAAGFALGWLTRRWGPDRFLDFAGAWQTAWRFNTALAFVAIATLPNADVGLLAVSVGMAIPLANILAVSALSRGGAIGLRSTLTKVALNPFLLASVLGVLVGLSGLIIPAPIMAPIILLSQAAIPVALLSIGATMNWGALARLDRFSGALNAIRLLILPALTFAACWLTGVEGPLAQVLVLFAALPTASAAHVLASGFGANRELVATLIAQSTLLAALSLPVWITVATLTF
ncbi:AEC family transporter [Aliiroseovarius subalbicans]|uniref:AEC family transporter n=1 Tax=Aliiroseovarius subalbicans TaxID=2925840 RepID=UPI001F571A56|nr:AEC family transporter [Aliiroseovarius subalbicans]MCI2399494.1 AEC family transporter [Aliiroseovarius subalbicans]